MSSEGKRRTFWSSFLKLEENTLCEYLAEENARYFAEIDHKRRERIEKWPFPIQILCDAAALTAIWLMVHWIFWTGPESEGIMAFGLIIVLMAPFVAVNWASRGVSSRHTSPLLRTWLMAEMLALAPLTTKELFSPFLDPRILLEGCITLVMFH